MTEIHFSWNPPHLAQMKLSGLGLLTLDEAIELSRELGTAFCDVVSYSFYNKNFSADHGQGRQRHHSIEGEDLEVMMGEFYESVFAL